MPHLNLTFLGVSARGEPEVLILQEKYPGLNALGVVGFGELDSDFGFDVEMNLPISSRNPKCASCIVVGDSSYKPIFLHFCVFYIFQLHFF